jgi:hypothetical protein
MALVYQTQKYFASQMMASAPNPKGPASVDIVQQQITFIVQLLVSGHWERFNLLLGLFALVSCIGAVLLGVKITEVADQSPRSFVLLTARAAADMEKYKRQIEKNWWRLAGWIGLTISLGVASNAIFYLALKYFGDS